MQIQMLKTYADSYRRQLRDHKEAGMTTIEMAILVSALIVLAVGLVVLLNNAYANRSAGIN